MAAAHVAADFDSPSAMLRATSRFLHRKGSAGFRPAPALLRPLAAAVNRLPAPWRRAVYTYSCGLEAASPETLTRAGWEGIARWAVAQYPRRRYQGVMIGSSNGAAVHLCALLGIPWLPQTVLLPMRREGNPHDLPADLERGLRWGEDFLRHHVSVELHHMLDPMQKLLMRRVTPYLRMKALRLGGAYRSFLRETLVAGGTIFLLDCRLRWPVARLGERHWFQFGAYGGTQAQEWPRPSQADSASVEGVERRGVQWDPPDADDVQPEAEWGFAEPLAEEVADLARSHGYRVRRIVIETPEDLSLFTAELYRWRYRMLAHLARDLVVDSFTLMDPFWTLRTRAVPLWLVFPTEPFDSLLERHLQRRRYERTGIFLFPHGADSLRIVPVERWLELCAQAGGKVSFLDRGMRAAFPSRFPLPRPLAFDDLDEFINEHGGNFPVRWEQE